MSAATLMPLGGGSADGAIACDRVAATAGSDANPGTLGEPFRTAQKLADSLAPGETGCLRAGTYEFDPHQTGGRSLKVTGAEITLASYPGERAKLVGRLWIARGADGVTVEGLDLDGSAAPPCTAPHSTCTILPSPVVNAANTVFRGNDVTNHHTGICFNLGSNEWGRAVRTLIERNRIHDCGRLPSTNFDHGVYAEASDGVVIRDNAIFDNADRGIQLYPDAQGTRIIGNVIDGNGYNLRISGADGTASSNTVAQYNVITNSRHYNVDSWYPAGNPIGAANVVRRNCIWGAFGRSIMGVAEPEGFSAGENVAADPQYVDRAGGDFRLRSGSPCLDLARVTLRSPRIWARIGSRVRLTGWAPAQSPVAGFSFASASFTGSSTALIQRRAGDRWRTIAQRPVSSDGRFAARVRIRARRAVRLRARVPGSGRSRPLRIRMHA